MLSIDPALIPEWEEEMTNAEAVRLQHPEAMDYLKAKTVAATPVQMSNLMPWAMEITMSLHGLNLLYKWKRYSVFITISQ